MDYYNHIRKVLEREIRLGKRDFVLFPFGKQGMLVKKILNEVFGIREVCIIDNNLSEINPNIKKVSEISCVGGD